MFFSGFFSLQHSRPSAPGNGDLNASRRANANDDLNAGGLFSFFFQGLFLAHFFIERQSALASGLVLVLPTLGTTNWKKIDNVAWRSKREIFNGRSKPTADGFLMGQ